MDHAPSVFRVKAEGTTSTSFHFFVLFLSLLPLLIISQTPPPPPLFKQTVAPVLGFFASIFAKDVALSSYSTLNLLHTVILLVQKQNIVCEYNVVLFFLFFHFSFSFFLFPVCIPIPYTSTADSVPSCFSQSIVGSMLY